MSSLSEINQKMPIYKGCTMGEILVVFFLSFIGLAIFFCVLCELIFNRFSAGLIIAGVTSLVLSRVLVGLLGKSKKNKPYGYYQQRFLGQLHAWGFIRLPFVIRIGKWGIGRYEKN